ncbi:MAG: hypothetical protein M1825_000976 [Sarcosagium campestre]|nr:MAG: hypothetical protein M1825_000976 [Sarcosagium campestre]
MFLAQEVIFNCRHRTIYRCVTWDSEAMHWDDQCPDCIVLNFHVSHYHALVVARERCNIAAEVYYGDGHSEGSPLRNLREAKAVLEAALAYTPQQVQALDARLLEQQHAIKARLPHDPLGVREAIAVELRDYRG